LVASVFEVDKSGNVFARNADGEGRRRPLNQMSFGPGAYPRGALWEVASISVDRVLSLSQVANSILRSKRMPYSPRGYDGGRSDC
jgi:hypothetical protein